MLNKGSHELIIKLVLIYKKHEYFLHSSDHEILDILYHKSDTFHGSISHVASLVLFINSFVNYIKQRIAIFIYLLPKISNNIRHGQDCCHLYQAWFHSRIAEILFNYIEESLRKSFNEKISFLTYFLCVR